MPASTCARCGTLFEGPICTGCGAPSADVLVRANQTVPAPAAERPIARTLMEFSAPPGAPSPGPPGAAPAPPVGAQTAVQGPRIEPTTGRMPAAPEAAPEAPLGQTAIDAEIQKRADAMMDSAPAAGIPVARPDRPRLPQTAPMMAAVQVPPQGPPQGAQAPHAPPAPRPGGRTLMGAGPEAALPPLPGGTPPLPGATPPNDKRTMLGLAASDLLPKPNPAAPPAAAAAPANPAKTMLGLAASDLLPRPQAAPPAPPAIGSDKRTLLGVAMPGIAPSGAPPPPVPPAQRLVTSQGIGEVPIVVLPAPSPYHDESLPPPPVKPTKKGLPLVAVLGGALALVVVLGIVLVVVLHARSSSLAVRPKMGEGGKELLLVRCDSCDDGTVIGLGGEKGTVKAHEAEVPAALKVGDNAFKLHIDRPGSGRDEDVEVSVPVAYRVKADLTTLSADVPTLTVRVEASNGSVVTVDGKPVALDAAGRGAVALELGDDGKGAAGETKPFERNVAFEVKQASGAVEKGSLLARAAIVPLVLDAPAETPVTATGSLVLVGRTVKGARVTVAGAPAQVDANGAFRAEVPLEPGPKKILLVSSAPPLATRRLEITGERFATPEAAVTRLESIGLPGFEAFGADPAAAKGKLVAIEGDVIESRAAGAVAILLVDDRRGCTRGPCIVRVLHTSFVARGEHVRAYGRVNGGVASAGKMVPEVAAEFVALGKAKK